MSISKKHLFASIATMATALMLLTIGEVVLRIQFKKIERITGVGEWKTEVGAKGLVYFWNEYHSEYGWTNVSGYHSDDRVPFQVSINRQRLRGSDDVAPTPAPVAGVCAMGWFLASSRA
jgi:hypothetical protein